MSIMSLRDGDRPSKQSILFSRDFGRDRHRASLHPPQVRCRSRKFIGEARRGTS